MNATALYAQLSRQVLTFKENVSEEWLSGFLNPEKGILKLKALLLCRVCRKLCVEPYSSEFCNHFLCQLCYIENRLSNGCKWCRIADNLFVDLQDKILVDLYNNLCAILLDYITGWDGGTGFSNTKQKLISFLSQNTLISNSRTIEEIKNIDKNVTRTAKKEEVIKKDAVTQSEFTCCKCEVYPKNCCDFGHGPIKTNSDDQHQSFKDKDSQTDELGVVSSTVNDEISKNNSNEDAELQPNQLVDQSKVSRGQEAVSLNTKKLYKSISSTILLEKRKRMSIFEKFGLALTPPPNKTDFADSKKNINQNKIKKTKPKNGSVEPKLEPLRLKMKKIANSDSNDSTYSVHYNITNNVTNKKEIENDLYLTDNSSDSSFDSRQRKKRKIRKCVNIFTVSSEDSDFEPSNAFRKQRKVCVPKPNEDREVCGCGTGSNIKYFTDICKRTRCPCFSQRRSCLDCKCKFCSNPYTLENETTTKRTLSESSLEDIDTQQSRNLTKEESDIVDIETM